MLIISTVFDPNAGYASLKSPPLNCNEHAQTAQVQEGGSPASSHEDGMTKGWQEFCAPE